MGTGIKRGILLMNLGSPDSTEVPDVRRYLREFLMDERVIDRPYLYRKLLVEGIIVPLRAPKSAAAYRSIWWEEGSPLIVLSEDLKNALRQHTTMPVAMGMRYGNPSMKHAFEALLEELPDMDEVILVPLYPHYAMSSYETAVEYAKLVHKKNKYRFGLAVARPFYNREGYVKVLANHIRPYLQDFDYLLFSYHGIPVRHILRSDITHSHCLKSEDCCETPSPAHACCYRHQVRTTTGLVARQLNLPQEKYGLSFQSRLGRAEWLKPDTVQCLTELPARGIKKLLVVCPAFVSDCLETLEEIAERGKHTFMENGGERFEMIPCLNTDPAWVATLQEWITEYIQGNKQWIWPIARQ